jgi:NADPH-dependent curcumin reductase CurA
MGDEHEDLDFPEGVSANMNWDQQPIDVPDYGRPTINRRVLLIRRPNGVPQSEDFAIDTVPVPEPGPNQFLIRNIFLSVDPAQRGWASTEVNYSAPVPLQDPMRGLATGVVVCSNDPNVVEGEFLYGFFDWQYYGLADLSKIVLRLRSPIPLHTATNLLGITGLTAYLALTELGRPVNGDTLLVSTAAGAVGSFVGQIGRILGCRTVGLTGDDEKVERCRSRYGYDAAFNYKTEDIATVLRWAAPNGINVYFDNTGGRILDVALRHAVQYARIVQCGTAATPSWNPPPRGPRNEREVLTRRLVWSGFVVFDWKDRFAKAASTLVEWYKAGKIVSDEDVSNGIDHTPGAIATVYSGQNRGKKLIYMG